MEKIKIFSLYLTIEQMDALKKMSYETGDYMSVIIRRGIDKELSDYEKNNSTGKN
jgi:predicted DNA-binding protein